MRGADRTCARVPAAAHHHSADRSGCPGTVLFCKRGVDPSTVCCSFSNMQPLALAPALPQTAPLSAADTDLLVGAVVPLNQRFYSTLGSRLELVFPLCVLVSLVAVCVSPPLSPSSLRSGPPFDILY